MSNRLKGITRWPLLATLLFVASGADCAERLRNISDTLEDIAGNIDDDDSNDFEDIWDDITDWFD